MQRIKYYVHTIYVPAILYKYIRMQQEQSHKQNMVLGHLLRLMLTPINTDVRKDTEAQMMSGKMLMDSRNVLPMSAYFNQICNRKVNYYATVGVMMF